MGASLLHVTQFASMAPAQFFIAGIWQGLLLTMVAWLALKASPLIGIKISPGTRFVLWMIVFILSAALPFSALLDRRSIAAGAHQSSALFSAPHLPAICAVAIVGVWMLASLFSMARLLWNIHRLHMLARTSTPVPVEALSSELRLLLNNSRSNKSQSRPVEICLSGSIDSPAAIGFFHPSVVIPSWLWRKLAPSELRQIVMHELAHLERRDDWTNLLQKFLCALFPLNPALLLAERQLCWEREMACDDAVLDAAISPKQYAACLASLAENRLLRRAQSLAPGAWRRHSELAERVHRVLQHKGALRPVHARAVVGAFLAVYLCAGLALARCPRLVAFTASAGGSVMPTTEAQSLIPDPLIQNRGARPMRAALRAEGMQRQSTPHLVDAAFRAPASFSAASGAQVPSARLRSESVAASSRGVSRHRLAAHPSQPALTQIRFTEPRRAQTQVAPTKLIETRLILNSVNSSRMDPAALAQALFMQALFIQAVEQAAPLPAGAGSATHLIFYLPPPPATPGSRTLASPEDSHSPGGWIIIQL